MRCVDSGSQAASEPATGGQLSPGDDALVEATPGAVDDAAAP